MRLLTAVLPFTLLLVAALPPALEAAATSASAPVGMPAATSPAPTTVGPRVAMTTSLGRVVIELDAARAPRTVANFLA